MSMVPSTFGPVRRQLFLCHWYPWAHLGQVLRVPRFVLEAHE